MTKPDSSHAEAYRQIAASLWRMLETGSARKPAPPCRSMLASRQRKPSEA